MLPMIHKNRHKIYHKLDHNSDREAYPRLESHGNPQVHTTSGGDPHTPRMVGGLIKNAKNRIPRLPRRELYNKTQRSGLDLCLLGWIWASWAGSAPPWLDLGFLSWIWAS